VVPPIELQYLLVVARELARPLRLPEHPRARPHEGVVEHLLVKGPLPAAPVQGLERLPAHGDALETVARRLGPLGAPGLQRSEDHGPRLGQRRELLELNVVVVEEGLTHGKTH